MLAYKPSVVQHIPTNTLLKLQAPAANMGGTKTIGPSPRYYAVIQMDPEAMIRDLHLDDEQALKEVQEMQPQKYLIYLAQVGFVLIYLPYPQLPPSVHTNWGFHLCCATMSLNYSI